MSMSDQRGPRQHVTCPTRTNQVNQAQHHKKLPQAQTGRGQISEDQRSCSSLVRRSHITKLLLAAQQHLHPDLGHLDW